MNANYVKRIFKQRFEAPPEIVTRAPGRVNLIGEHTDYNDGYVLPAAIDQEIWLAASRTGSSECIVYSETLGREARFSLEDLTPEKVDPWARYVAGIAWAIQQETKRSLPGVRMAVSSELSVGAGLSSSAAIEMAPGVMWNSLAELMLSPEALARLGQKCENEFLGVKSGIMDQMASACGRKSSALFIDIRTLETQAIHIPAELGIVVCDTGQARSLAGSKYNERRAECEQAVKEIQTIHPHVNSLRDVTTEMLEEADSVLSEIPRKRARHVVMENARVLRLISALQSDNRSAIHALMAASHESLRDDYEVSSDALDQMVEAAEFAPGCVGVRMTGAGFGGACVALVEADKTSVFMRATENSYRQVSKHTPKLLACSAVEGASVVNA